MHSLDSIIETYGDVSDFIDALEDSGYLFELFETGSVDITRICGAADSRRRILRLTLEVEHGD